MKIGCSLSSEEMDPRDMIRWAQQAESAGFTSCAISDHFHPWIDRQGQSPFVWSVLGALATVTDRRLVTSAALSQPEASLRRVRAAMSSPPEFALSCVFDLTQQSP